VKYSNLEDYVKADLTMLPFVFGIDLMFEIYFVLYGKRTEYDCPEIKEISKKLRPFLNTYGTEGSTPETREKSFEQIFGFDIHKIPAKFITPDFHTSAFCSNENDVLFSKLLNKFVVDFEVTPSEDAKSILALGYGVAVRIANKQNIVKNEPQLTQPKFYDFLFRTLILSKFSKTLDGRRFYQEIACIYFDYEMMKRAS